jgi:hypothetical protein
LVSGLPSEAFRANPTRILDASESSEIVQSSAEVDMSALSSFVQVVASADLDRDDRIRVAKL